MQLAQLDDSDAEQTDERCGDRFIMPNTHRRRRPDETVELRRVGVGGVYMNSQLAHDDRDADGFGDVNAAVGRDQVFILQPVL